MGKKTDIIFTGDIGFDKYMDRRWEDKDFLSEDVMRFLHNTNHLVVNVEGPLSEGEKTTRSNGVAALTHCMNPEAVSFLDDIGADIWNICNNHIMDSGARGISDTLKLAGKRGVKTLGAGMNIDEASAPVIIDGAGGIGLIGVGYQRACRKADENTPGCFSWSDLDRIRKQIEDIKSRCRWCIVVAHAGEEFTALPSPYTRDRYIEYLNMGADIVVSHHPHVPNNYETFEDGKVIFYSLGNFVFDTDYQRSQYHTEEGLFVKLSFAEDDFSFEPFGIKIDRTDGRIVAGSVPRIFADISADEYDKLAPLNAKVLVENTKRQLRFLKPAEYENATEEDFVKNFYEPLRSGRVPGETLDFQIIYPLSQQVKEGAHLDSKHKDIVEYMLEMIPK